MRLLRRKRTRSSVVVFSVAALALAMTGILYAHWTSSLSVEGSVQTGSISPVWVQADTNDDGTAGYFNTFLGDVQVDGDPSTVYTHPDWGSGSVDPGSIFAGWERGEPHDTFFDKDVASCFAEIVDEGTRLVVSVQNGYPGYHCWAVGELLNDGTVPVKLQAATMTATFNGDAVDLVLQGSGNFYIDTDGDYPSAWDDQDRDLWGLFYGGDLSGANDPLECGVQLDPAGDGMFGLFFDVGLFQDAVQAASYVVSVDLDWVNWNEYDQAMCDPLEP